MKKIGLTGGLGSGKSTVAAMLRARGIPVIDTDAVARQVVQPGSPTLHRLRKTFGAHYIKRDGSLDRAKLAATVFAKPSLVGKLNAIIHPPIWRAVKNSLAKLRAARAPWVVIDVPLLMETGLEREMDKIVVVWAPVATRIRRLQRSRNLSLAAIKQRIRAQLPLHVKKRRADYVIDNSRTKAETRRQTAELIRKLTKG